MRVPVAVLVLIWTGSVADAAARVPLPRPRPPQFGQHGVSAPGPVAPKFLAVPAANAPAAHEAAPPLPAAVQDDAPKPHDSAKAEPPKPSACQIALKAVAVFKPMPPVKGAGECGITDPVSLEAAILPGGTQVTLNPPATLRCEMAQAVAHWLRDDVAQIVGHLGAPLTGIENYESYDCRSRNRVFGAKMSEHGRGNALDVKAVKLATGMMAHLTDPHVAKDLRNDLRKSTCERFKTVLGPGSDGYHENHIHVDLAERNSSFRLCQWDVRMPLERVSPSPHIVMSQSPTPHVSMTIAATTSIVATGAKATNIATTITKTSAIVPKPRPRPKRRRSAAQH